MEQHSSLRNNISHQIANYVDLAKNLRITNPALFWILVFTLLTRIAIYLAGRPWDESVITNTILIGDGAQYHEIAVGFLNGTALSETNWATDRTLGYPYFVTAIYAISSNSIWLVFAIQTLINIAMVPMVYWTAKTIFSSRRAGNLAAVTFTLSAISVAWASRYLYTETLFTLFLLIFLIIFVKIWSRDSLRWFLILGIMLGLATITRSVLQYFIVVPVAIILLQDRTFHRKAILSGITVVGLLVIIAPFQLRNLNEYGHYSLSTISGNVLFQSAIKAKARADGTDFYQAMDDMGFQEWADTPNPFDLSRINKSEGLNSVKENPVDFAVLYVQGIISFLIGTEKSSYLYVIFNQDRPVLGTPHNAETFSERIVRNIKDTKNEYFLTPILIIKLLIEYVAIALGLMILLRGKQKTMALLFVLTIAYFILATGFMGRAPRYKIPVLPLYAILAGGGFTLIWSYIQSIKQKPRSES
jgi:4-amino-4-deoxy-L-arabinose transferase-like glycosyltransferase